MSAEGLPLKDVKDELITEKQLSEGDWTVFLTAETFSALLKDSQFLFAAV